MMTITLQIGNSDDRLSQVRWHEYVESVRSLLEADPRVQVHFFGAPPNWAPWQNAAWVFACPHDGIAALRESLVANRQQFSQVSIAWTEGITKFL